MALIRQAQLGDTLRSAIVLDLGDLMRQGEMLKTAARAEADQIVSRAHAERRALLDAGAEEGRREGLAQGLEEGRVQGAAEGRDAALAELKPRIEGLEKAWTAALNDFAARREELLSQARTDVLRLATQVAEVVTRRAIELQGGAAEAQLAAALGVVAGQSKVSIRVNPADRKAFSAALPRLAERLTNAREAEIVPDESLPSGSCVLTSPSGGEVDASIDTQLERIAEALLPRKGARKRSRKS